MSLKDEINRGIFPHSTDCYYSGAKTEVLTMAIQWHGLSDEEWQVWKKLQSTAEHLK